MLVLLVKVADSEYNNICYKTLEGVLLGRLCERQCSCT